MFILDLEAANSFSHVRYTVHLKSYEPLRIIIIFKLLQYHLNIMDD